MTELNDLLITSPELDEERLETLKTLLPDLFTDEGKLNPVELKRLVDGDASTGREQYDFNWRGKARSKRHAFTPSRAALTYDLERSVSPDKAFSNMIIEGENLEVLKLLASAYREQVKCIYIDPPYNKGSDLIYSDNFTRDRKEYWEDNGSHQDGIKMDTNPETSGRYHSDWLSMMYSRILVARQLLKDDGAIFVSIDDNEVHNLKKLMEDVFGEENFVGQIAVQLNPRGRHLDKFLAQTHEYVLVFAKDINSEPLNQLEKSDRMITEYNREDEEGKYRDLGLRNRNPLFNKTTRPNLYYPIYVNPETEHVALESNEDFSVEVYPLNSSGEDSCWTWGKTKFKKNNNLLLARKTRGGDWRIFRKDYLIKDGKLATTLPKALWTDKEINNDYGKRAIKSIFNDNVFDFPKSPHLIKKIAKIGTSDGDIIFDFFAGSGSTAQAIMELNQEEEEVQRSFVLVDLPVPISDKTTIGQKALSLGFKTISDIMIERCKRIVDGYGDNPQSLDTGFKVYRLTKSHFPRAEFIPDPDKSTEGNVELLKQYIAEKESSFHMSFDQDQVLDEVLLKQGFRLDYTLHKREQFTANAVYLADDGERKAFISLDMGLEDQTVDYFKTNTDTTFICLERALDTTKKWNLKHNLGERLKAI